MFSKIGSAILEIVGVALTLLGMIKLVEGLTIDTSLVMPGVLMLLAGITMGVFGKVMPK